MAKDEHRFEGFPRAAIKFLKELDQNNSREWFDAHRSVYEDSIAAPSKAFVVAAGERLAKIAPGVQAEPRVNGSIFRINRDTRFSADKRPYKANVGIFFWEGSRPKMECSGFYFHLEPDALMLGVGLYMFPRDLIDAYRAAVVDAKLGPALRKAVETVGPGLVGKAGCGMAIDRYARVPKGYPADHPNAEYLKLKGLHAGCEEKLPAALHSAAIVDFAVERWSRLAPLHRWLVKALDRG
jgi:uncharacterized protein (TIGR02453 family)